ncbi:MAG: 2-phospho-L-lactate transferase CofD family protein [Promethearchaeota archaeon]
MISILVSGKESLKFLNGFLEIISPEETPLNVIVDTFDFFDFYDMRVYPQLTNVLLLFMNQLNETRWTGRNKDSLEISNFLQNVDDKYPSLEEIHEVGDLYLAPNIFINHRLKNNHKMSTCINELSKNITAAVIIPLSNDELKLEFNFKDLSTIEGFNEQKSSINALFDAFESITLSNEAKAALLKSELILLPKPSVVSILSFLKILKEVLKDAVGQIIFVSPITEKGLDSTSLQAFQEMRLPESSIGISKILRGLVDVYVIDTIEEPHKNRITRYGMKVVSHPLTLDTIKNQLDVVEFVLKLTPFRDVVESFEYKTKKEVDSLKQGFKKLFGGLKRITSRPSPNNEAYDEEEDDDEDTEE